jgi:glycosyltransferase involved in cell wall biosynthesis
MLLTAGELRILKDVKIIYLNNMKFSILTIAYNEQETIKAVMDQWKDFKHLVLHSKKPWHGESQPKDDTENIVKGYPNAEFIEMDWKSEHEQRNWGLGYLYNYDYVIIIDADELYTKEDREKILDEIENGFEVEKIRECFRIDEVKTYFKTLDYTIYPQDTHKPVIAVNPKKILFTEARLVNTDYQIPIKAIMHHLSYCKSDKKMKVKFSQFEHCDQVNKDWFDRVWKKWDKNMENIRAYGNENSKAVFSPAPQEIKNILL